MSKKLEEILTRIGQKWHQDLAGFISGREASREFFEFLDGNKDCQEAVNLAFDSLANNLTDFQKASGH